MADRSDGYFVAYVNSRAGGPSPGDRALMARIGEVVKTIAPSSQVRWAGSQHKATAIDNSDLDMCVESRDPVTEAQRRDLRAALEAALGRPCRVLSHVVRLPSQGGDAKVDMAFANAAFGGRPLPDTTEFKNRPGRQAAARALKLWTRGGNKPYVPGWAVEALVVHLDQPPDTHSALPLFLRIVDWLSRATPSVIEGVLRAAVFPKWNDDWSRRLPGVLEAFRNHARALQRRLPSPASWRDPADVKPWLLG